MKKILTLTAALTLCASMAFAAGGLNLYATDCGPGSVTNLGNTCTSNVGSINLYGSIIVPSAQPLFVASGQILDIQSSQATLPSWWDFNVCRAGDISAVFGGAAGGTGTVGSCLGSIWDGHASPTGFTGIQAGVGGANRVRINSGAAVAVPYALQADGTSELGVINYNILKLSTAGGGSCAGCSLGACIVLNEINLQNADNSVTVISTPLVSNYVNYNNGSNIPACPQSTPTQNRTWGSVKAMYR